MSKNNMTAPDWIARAEALEECADHLDQAWTDDPVERKQGNMVARGLRQRGEQCRIKAETAPMYLSERPITLHGALKRHHTLPRS